MFCMKCGTKLPDDALFCFKCGMKMDFITKGGSEKKAAPSVNGNKAKENPIKNENKIVTVKRENLLLDALLKVFDDPGMFGKQVYFFHAHPFNDKQMNNIIIYYLRHKDETPLLSFDYDNDFEEGLVFTTHRIVWRFGEVDSVSYENIEDIVLKRSVLAKVMRITDTNYVEHSKVYLTGIRNDDKFFDKAKEFALTAKHLLTHASEKGLHII